MSEMQVKACQGFQNIYNLNQAESFRVSVHSFLFEERN